MDKKKKSGDRVKRRGNVNKEYLLWIYSHWNEKVTRKLDN